MKTRFSRNLLRRYYPDWRRLINECQRYAATGAINSAILVDVADVNLDALSGVSQEERVH